MPLLPLAQDWITKTLTELNLTIQLCMPLPIALLHSTTMKAVTNVRASGDYRAGNDNWRIGTVSLLHDALGFQPSKDDLWTGEFVFEPLPRPLRVLHMRCRPVGVQCAS